MTYPKRTTSQKTTQYKAFVESVERASAILICSHQDPDGDSLGSQLALYGYIKSLGKEPRIVNQGIVPDKYRFLPGIDRVENIEYYRDNQAFDLAVLLECPGIDRIGDVRRLLHDKTVLVNIDHHPDNSFYGNISLVDSVASSVGEMLFEFYMSIGYDLDREAATQLYAAILTDTGRFRFNSTSKRTMEIAGALIDTGADPRTICDQIYYSMAPSTLKLTGAALSKMEFYEDGQICLMRLERRMLYENGADWDEIEGLTDYTLYGRNVIIGALLKEVDDSTTRVSLRSRHDIDVSRMAHKYNGGGHVNASGYTVELPLDDAYEQLLSEMREIIDASV